MLAVRNQENPCPRLRSPPPEALKTPSPFSRKRLVLPYGTGPPACATVYVLYSVLSTYVRSTCYKVWRCAGTRTPQYGVRNIVVPLCHVQGYGVQLRLGEEGQ